MVRPFCRTGKCVHFRKKLKICKILTGKRQYTESIIPGGAGNYLEQSSGVADSRSRCGRCLENRRRKWRQENKRGTCTGGGGWGWPGALFFWFLTLVAWLEAFTSLVPCWWCSDVHAWSCFPWPRCTDARWILSLLADPVTPDRNSRGLDVNRIACDFWRIRGREIIETGSTPGQWISWMPELVNTAYRWTFIQVVMLKFCYFLWGVVLLSFNFQELSVEIMLMVLAWLVGAVPHYNVVL